MSKKACLLAGGVFSLFDSLRFLRQEGHHPELIQNDEAESELYSS